MKSLTVLIFVFLILQVSYSKMTCQEVRCLGGLICAAINDVPTCIQRHDTVKMITYVNQNISDDQCSKTNDWFNVYGWYDTLTNFYYGSKV